MLTQLQVIELIWFCRVGVICLVWLCIQQTLRWLNEMYDKKQETVFVSE